MKDILLYVRVTDMKHMCVELAADEYPESERLKAAADAFESMLEGIRKRVEDGKSD